MERTHRIIYRLWIDLGEIEGKPGSTVGVCICLDGDGNDLLKSGARPRDKTKRMIDLRPGDQILHGGRYRTIRKIETESETWVTEQEAREHTGDGYVYRPKNRTEPNIGPYAGHPSSWRKE